MWADCQNWFSFTQKLFSLKQRHFFFIYDLDELIHKVEKAFLNQNFPFKVCLRHLKGNSYQRIPEWNIPFAMRVNFEQLVEVFCIIYKTVSLKMLYYLVFVSKKQVVGIMQGKSLTLDPVYCSGFSDKQLALDLDSLMDFYFVLTLEYLNIFNPDAQLTLNETKSFRFQSIDEFLIVLDINIVPNTARWPHIEITGPKRQLLLMDWGINPFCLYINLWNDYPLII